ncbi:hypothetical protein ABTG52_09460 [Acinetobacter baumannii]
MKKYYNEVEEEYSTNGFNYKTDKAMYMTKGGDRCPSPPKHSSYVHKQSYEAYDGGHTKHGHDGYKSHQSESWIEKEKHNDHHHNGGGWGGNHGGHSEHSGGWGGNHAGHGGWGGAKHGGYSEHGGNYSSGGACHNGGGSGGSYGLHYESYKSMGGPQKGAPLWNFKGITE